MVSVVIPATIAEVGNNAFSNNSALTVITFEREAQDGVTALGKGVFDGCAALELIVAPSGSTEAYTEEIAESSPGVAEQVRVVDTQPTYKITWNIGQGWIYLSDSIPHAGDTVKFSVLPAQGYVVDSVKVTGANNQIVPIYLYDSTYQYSFMMPASNVTITATFTASGIDGNFGSWWSSTEYGSTMAYYRRMFYNGEFANWSGYDKFYLLSVCCLQDSAVGVL